MDNTSNHTDRGEFLRKEITAEFPSVAPAEKLTWVKFEKPGTC